MTEPYTIIPEGNHELRRLLASFVQHQERLTAAQIKLALLDSPVRLFVHVTRQVGAEGEPPITAADLALMCLEDGRPIRMIRAVTMFTPDHLSTGLAEEGIYCRQLSAKALYLLCLERGILGIELDGGLDTEVLIGPIRVGEHLDVSLMPKV